jgi:hypothetical protein
MLRLLLAAAVALIIGAASASATPGPRLRVDQAASLAQAHLKERGLDGRVFVSALTLESTAVARGKAYWYARWSDAVAGEEKKEVGLRINMDGSLVRVVENPAKKYKDHRARTSRPSVLDLKH